MTYQRDPDRPTEPLRDKDPLSPQRPIDQRLSDKALEGMDVPRDGTSMAGILGVIAVLALIVLGISFFRGPSATDPARTASQERTLPPPATIAPDSTTVPK